MIQIIDQMTKQKEADDTKVTKRGDPYKFRCWMRICHNETGFKTGFILIGFSFVSNRDPVQIYSKMLKPMNTNTFII